MQKCHRYLSLMDNVIKRNLNEMHNFRDMYALLMPG